MGEGVLYSRKQKGNHHWPWRFRSLLPIFLHNPTSPKEASRKGGFRRGGCVNWYSYNMANIVLIVIRESWPVVREGGGVQK